MFKIFSPATTANLGAGFDVFGAALDFGNELEVYPDEPFSIKIIGEGSSTLSKDKDNLIYKAYRKFFDAIGKPLVESSFLIKSRIPLARGLGSSASAVISGIYASMTITEIKDFALASNLAIELEGHPDNVIPCLFGGIRLCYFSKNQWKSEALKIPENLSLVLVVPSQRQSTSRARRAIGLTVPVDKAVFNIARSCLFVYCLEREKYDLLKEATLDMIHQEKRLKIIKNADRFFKEMLMHENCLAGWLSGSGSAMVFMAHKSDETAVLESARRTLVEKDIDAKVVTVAFSREGTKVIMGLS